MASHDYVFQTRWRVPGTREAVSEILADAAALPRWWPAVYLSVEIERAGDEAGVGKVVHLHSRGALPYTLRWSFEVTRADVPAGFAIVATGDFVGDGVWTLIQEGSDVLVIYDWRVRTEKPVLRAFSWLLKPIFSWNHHWAMARGEESLRLELARRRGQPTAAPPGPVTGLAGVLRALWG